MMETGKFDGASDAERATQCDLSMHLATQSGDTACAEGDGTAYCKVESRL